MNNNKGFTLIELLAVIILLILIIVMAIVNLMPSYDKGEKKSFVNEAFVFSEGAINKYSDDRLQNYFVDDIFYGLNNNKSCYSHGKSFNNMAKRMTYTIFIIIKKNIIIS